MLARPQSGLDLPLKALITEASPGKVDVLLDSAACTVRRHDLPAGLLEHLAPAEQLIASVLDGIGEKHRAMPAEQQN